MGLPLCSRLGLGGRGRGGSWAGLAVVGGGVPPERPGRVGWSLTELHDSGIELGDLLSFYLLSPVSPGGQSAVPTRVLKYKQFLSPVKNWARAAGARKPGLEQRRMSLSPQTWPLLLCGVQWDLQ